MTHDDIIGDVSQPPVPGFFADAEPGRRGEILDAAASVFADKGYDNGSMRDIARRVGVSEPALYRHFAGKQALFETFIRAAAGRLRSEAFALIDGAEAGQLRDYLCAALEDRRRTLRLYGPILRTVISAAGHHPGFLELYRREIVDPIRARLTAKAGEIDSACGVVDGDATRAGRVRSVMALFVGYFVTSMVLADAPDDAIAEAFLRVMGWQDGPAGGVDDDVDEG